MEGNCVQGLNFRRVTENCLHTIDCLNQCLVKCNNSIEDILAGEGLGTGIVGSVRV